MNEDSKARAISIVNRLYISICVVTLILIIGLTISSVSDEIQKTNVFERAHSKLEERLRYDPKRPGESLERSRELLASDAAIRDAIKKVKPHAFDDEEDATNDLIAAACFDSEGGLVSIKKRCTHIYNLHPGKPFKVLFQHLVLLLATIAAMFLLRKWATWVVAKPK